MRGLSFCVRWVDKGAQSEYDKCIKFVNTLRGGDEVIAIDYRDRRPLNEQVTEQLQKLILAGVLPADSRLPSVRELAMELSINPNTVQRAYAELERRGLIYPVKGKGNFVASGTDIQEQKKKEAQAKLRDALEACEGAGMTRSAILAEARAWAEEVKA